MPERFIREMVADWAGAGRAISGQWEVKQWWFGTEERPGGNRVRILLHPKTLDLVDGFVIQLDQELNRDLNAKANEKAESENARYRLRMAKYQGTTCHFCGHHYTGIDDIIERSVVRATSNLNKFEVGCKACYEKSKQ